jgi:hypothetical protein
LWPSQFLEKTVGAYPQVERNDARCDSDPPRQATRILLGKLGSWNPAKSVERDSFGSHNANATYIAQAMSHLAQCQTKIEAALWKRIKARRRRTLSAA